MPLEPITPVNPDPVNPSSSSTVIAAIIDYYDRTLIYDFTKHIKMSTYKINPFYKDGYSEWKDITGLIHRKEKLFSGRVEGSFDLYFETPEEFNEFISVMSDECDLYEPVYLQFYYPGYRDVNHEFVLLTVDDITWDIPYYGTKNQQHEPIHISFKSGYYTDT